jgi:hypothetical protein
MNMVPFLLLPIESDFILFYFDAAFIVPLIPSPGSPNITFTFQSSSVSTYMSSAHVYIFAHFAWLSNERVSSFKMVFLRRASGQKRLYSLMLPGSLLTVLFVVSFFAIARKKAFIPMR